MIFHASNESAFCKAFKRTCFLERPCRMHFRGLLKQLPKIAGMKSLIILNSGRLEVIIGQCLKGPDSSVNFQDSEYIPQGLNEYVKEHTARDYF